MVLNKLYYKKWLKYPWLESTIWTMKWIKQIISLPILANTWSYIRHHRLSFVRETQPSICILLHVQSCKAGVHEHSSLVLLSPTESLFFLALATAGVQGSVHWGGACVGLGNAEGGRSVTVRGSDGEPAWPGQTTARECRSEPVTCVWNTVSTKMSPVTSVPTFKPCFILTF